MCVYTVENTYKLQGQYSLNKKVLSQSLMHSTSQVQHVSRNKSPSFGPSSS